jgi:hypothetical protein
VDGAPQTDVLRVAVRQSLADHRVPAGTLFCNSALPSLRVSTRRGTHRKPLPYTALDSVSAIKAAEGLHVSLVSSAVHFSTDQIVLWPNDAHPTHLFVCDESSTNPAVQRVDLSLPAASNATTIVTGIVGCDPIRRTPWGTLIAGEETSDGGVYEIMNPMSITAPIAVLNRGAGLTSDPRVVKRKAIGQLAWEGNPVLPDGTIIFADELRPGAGSPGGAVYKFVPQFAYSSGPVITDASISPLASGQIYGLRLGSNGDYGQGTEIGQGVWVPIDEPGAGGFARRTTSPSGRRG